jgi:UDP-N-acetylglucosamine--N-acetylmuramyl-(pentapeptide) pyrophosphoryl-undecaprenol N-acetylglucosamine transferase
VFVTLGTIKPYRFDRLVELMLDSGEANVETAWQLGVTDRTDLPGRATEQMEAADFGAAARSADVVITHAGVGTILGLLEMGVYPIVVPRRSHLSEHVDDHQLQICDLLKETGVARVLEEDEAITTELLDEVSNWRVAESLGIRAL